MSSERIRIGVDLGGTKTEIIALSEQGEELYRFREASPRGDYLATVNTVVGLVTKAERELGAMATVGLATPGALSFNHTELEFFNRPLKKFQFGMVE